MCFPAVPSVILLMRIITLPFPDESTEESDWDLLSMLKKIWFQHSFETDSSYISPVTGRYVSSCCRRVLVPSPFLQETSSGEVQQSPVVSGQLWFWMCKAILNEKNLHSVSPLVQPLCFYSLPTEVAAFFTLVVYYGSKCIKISGIQNLFCDLEVHVTLTFSGTEGSESLRHSWAFQWGNPLTKMSNLINDV